MSNHKPPPPELSAAVLSLAIQMRAIRAVLVDFLMHVQTVAQLEQSAAAVRETAKAAGPSRPIGTERLEQTHLGEILGASAAIYAEAAASRRRREADIALARKPPAGRS
jgi:hypothetical protein